MDITTSQPNLIDPSFQWLLDRKISYELLQTTGIHVKNGQIVIPVKDEDGRVSFNKYRRNPFVHEGPKYTYDAGSKSSLFNIHTITGLRGENIFITEGELDCVLLNTFGLNAVSSTGGAGTFNQEWVGHFLHNNVFICFDRDEAGLRGALRVQQMIPHARIIFLPANMKGKDVTDYFKTHTLKEFESLAYESHSWNISKDISEIPESKTDIDKIIRDISKEIDGLMEDKRDANMFGQETIHIDILIESLNNRIENWKKIKKNFGKKFSPQGGDDIAKAKSVPLTNYLKFNSAGFASCPFHNDDSPSLKIYNDNHVYCFGCSKRADTIDIVMRQRGIDLVEAVKVILGRT